MEQKFFNIFFVLFDPIYPLIWIIIFIGPILGFWAKVDDRAQCGPKIFFILFDLLTFPLFENFSVIMSYIF